MGGGRGPSLGARPALEQRGHVFGLAPATTDLDERADNRSHHVTQEPVSGDFIREKAVECHASPDRVMVRVVPLVSLPAL